MKHDKICEHGILWYQELINYFDRLLSKKVFLKSNGMMSDLENSLPKQVVARRKMWYHYEIIVKLALNLGLATSYIYVIIAVWIYTVYNLVKMFSTFWITIQNLIMDSL